MADSLFDLKGKVAVVSGAASGLGKATALALGDHGASLLLADFNAEGLSETSTLLQAKGVCVVKQTCDVSHPGQIKDLFATLDREFGKIDFLANIAGEGILVPPEKLTQEQLSQVFQNLVFGRFAMCQQAGTRMLAQGGGSIVNIGSLASITGMGRGHIAYSMAMGAVAQMTRELSTEWARRGVRVNAILPAQVKNPSLEKRMAADPGLENQWLMGIPRGRLGMPTDIQGLMVLLASDASSWITGALIPMDGGNLAMNSGGTIGG
ncbi:MAG: SDR family oxidoreductase [Gemmataceae bacterium]|nr:SDR family oxidoreductase [Gemmataceae bacterium]